MDYSGPVASENDIEGITYFDHPGNPSYPSKWHVREDGWMGAAFCHAEPYLLKKAEPLVLRYMLVAHAGPQLNFNNENHAKRFAARPGFEVGKSTQPHRQFYVKRKGKKSPKPR